MMIDAASETKKHQSTKNQVKIYHTQAEHDHDEGDVENSLQFYLTASYLQQPRTLELAHTHLKIAAILRLRRAHEAALVHLKEARGILQQRNKTA